MSEAIDYWSVQGDTATRDNFSWRLSEMACVGWEAPNLVTMRMLGETDFHEFPIPGGEYQSMKASDQLAKLFHKVVSERANNPDAMEAARRDQAMIRRLARAN